jgi:hypothetical protein
MKNVKENKVNSGLKSMFTIMLMSTGTVFGNTGTESGSASNDVDPVYTTMYFGVLFIAAVAVFLFFKKREEKAERLKQKRRTQYSAIVPKKGRRTMDITGNRKTSAAGFADNAVQFLTQAQRA